MKWNKIENHRTFCESEEEITEKEIYAEFEKVYNVLGDIQDRLNRSTNVELREKYMRHLVDFMNWMDYEI